MKNSLSNYPAAAGSATSSPFPVALNLTIIKPEKLDYRTLFGLVASYRKAAHDVFPDYIHLTPAGYKAFRTNIGGEGARFNKFLGIVVQVDPEMANVAK